MGGVPLHKDTFKNGIPYPNPFETSFVKQVEKSSRSMFHYSEEKFNIKAREYSPAIPISYTLPNQREPDVLFDNRQANIKDHRVHPSEFKSGNANWTNNLVVSNRSYAKFADLMDSHKQQMQRAGTMTPSGGKTCDDLVNNYGNVNTQQDIFFQSIHFFKNGFAPPLHNPENFYTGNFSLKIKASYKKAQDIVLTVDDYLKTQNINKPRNDSEWEHFNKHVIPQLKAELSNKFGNTTWGIFDDF